MSNSASVPKKRGFPMLIISVIMLLIGGEELREYLMLPADDRFHLELAIAIPLLAIGGILFFCGLYFTNKEKGI